MKIVLVCKGRLEDLPPVMSAATGMAALGVSVTVLTSGCIRKTISGLEQRGVTVVQLQEDVAKPKGILQKIRYWRAFRERAWKAVSQTTHDLLWVGSADTALALGRRLLAHPYVLQQHELYDKQPAYKCLLRRYARRAISVIVPELCRANIIRSWYDLSQTPFVLPNKPDDHPRRRKVLVQDQHARRQLATLNGEKMVLYKGGIGIARDVRPVAEAVQDLGKGWRFAVMGPDYLGYLDLLRKAYPRLLHIPKIVAPDHLQITSHAHVGVLTYSRDCLNNLFCAPNKVWEYAGFGLPMLCNDLPSLQFTVQVAGAGVCIDSQDREKIASSLLEIDQNYQAYRECALRLYDSVDLHDIMRRILEHASHAIGV